MPNVNTISFGPGQANVDLQVQQLQLQRQQQLADMLRQQAVTPAETQMVSGRAVPNSPWLGVTQIAKALLANRSQGKIDQKQSDLGTAASQRWASTLRSLAPQGTFDPQQGAAPPPMPGGQSPAPSQMSAPAQAMPGGGMPSGPLADGSAGAPAPMSAAPAPQVSQPPEAAPGQVTPAMRQKWSQALNAFSISPDLGNKLLENIMTMTPEQKNNEAYGINPTDVRAGMLRELGSKGQQNLRAGSTVTRTNPDGSISPMFTAPDMHTGTNMTWNNGTPSAAPIPGVNEIVANRAAAELRGKNSETLAPPDQQVVLPNGTRQPATIASTIGGISQPQGAAPQPAAAASAGMPPNVRALLMQAAQTQDPAQRADLLKQANAMQPQPAGVGAPFGQEKGAEAAQGELSKKWLALTDANQQAQTTNSYLQNINGLAEKANTGALSGKLAFANSLLALVGNERANDATTANNLLDKYSNQITARLGSGGMATDAGRAIIASAYPNAHMNKAAINEAVNNLVGANDMTKARTVLLAPHANNRDPQAYNQQEVAFDQAADPRIWEWRNIKDPSAKRAFAASVVKQDPTFPQRIEALEQMGAFK